MNSKRLSPVRVLISGLIAIASNCAWAEAGGMRSTPLYSPRVVGVLGLPVSSLGPLLGLVGRVSLGGGYSLINYEGPKLPINPDFNGAIAKPKPSSMNDGQEVAPSLGSNVGVPTVSFLSSRGDESTDQNDYQKNIVGLVPALDIPFIDPSSGYPLLVYGPIFSGTERSPSPISGSDGQLSPAPTPDNPDAVAQRYIPGIVTEFLSMPSEYSLPTLSSASAPNDDRNMISNCGSTADLTRMAVFTELNLLPNNQLFAYARSEDGSLCGAGSFSTGGLAGYPGLSSSGPNSILVENGYVLAVNFNSVGNSPARESVSAFRIERDRLILTDIEPVFGERPLSLIRDGDRIYVVDNMAAADATLDASLPMLAAVQILKFDKTTGNLSPASDTAMTPILTDGMNAGLELNQSEFGTLPGSAVPTELLSAVTIENSLIHSLSAATNDGIWSTLSQADSTPHLYSSDFRDSTISDWQINPDSSLKLVSRTTSASLSPEDRALGMSGGMDVTISVNGRESYLYALNNPRYLSFGAPTARLVGFRIDHDGSLVRLGNAVASGLSNTAFGLSAL